MITKHTPGPWSKKWDNESHFARGLYIVSEKVNIALMLSQVDADLIAAAPDLLEALYLWKQFWDSMPKGQLGRISCDIGILNDAFLTMGKAIAKAEGQL